MRGKTLIYTLKNASKVFFQLTVLQRYILLFLLFFLPFVVLPFGVTHYETPKVIVAEIGIIFLVLILTVIKDIKIIKIIPTQTFWLLAGLGILSVYHLIFSQTFGSFLGNAFRLQGMFLFWMLLLFTWVVGVIKQQVTISPKVIFALLLAHLYFAFEGRLTIDGRSVGTVGEPNAFAAVIVFLWPWILRETKEHRDKVTKGIKGKKREYSSSLSDTAQRWSRRVGFWFRSFDKLRIKQAQPVIVGLGMLVSVCIILLTGSRSGLLAFGLQLLFLLLARFVSVKKAVISIITIIFFITFMPLLDTATVYENRGEIWKTALIAGYEHPITGWGIGNTEVVLQEYNIKLYNRLRGYYVDSAHNFLLDWWVQGGFIGVSIIILLIINGLTSYIQTKDIVKLTLLFGVLIVMLFNPVSVATLLGFWWLIGSVIAM